MNNEEQEHVFKLALQTLRFNIDFDETFIYKAYMEAFSNIEKLAEAKLQKPIIINPLHLINLVVYEYAYSIKEIDESRKDALLADEKFFRVFSRMVVEKYISNYYLAPRNDALMNRYEPPISTLEMHVNNTLRMFGKFPQNVPAQTVFIDTLHKCFDLIRAVLLLVTRGYETEAFSTWRTLHETECVALIFSKFGNPVIEAYVRHIKYGVAFRGLLGSKEETDEVFVRIKAEMHTHDLRSKDTKRFIEYGWMYAIPEDKRNPEFKINFRNGMEAMAGLSHDSEIYEMASEISHSSPLLIYSNPRFFMEMTIIQVYESFFNVESIFNLIYSSTLNEENKANYLGIRNRNIADLKAIYNIEKQKLNKMQSAK